ncbi:hypothetical protein A5721_18935 [Mycobacterium vulneris]|nr:hypothetical protein A5721_18935 [Mycolicibacterium vulneris]
MAPRGKFKLNRRTVRMIAREDPKLTEAVDDVADEVARRAGPSATVDHYTTDRHVGGVVVPAVDQARNGTLTRAAQGAAAESKKAPPSQGPVRAFRSRAEWRRAFASGASNASARARVSATYAALPEKARRGDA